MQGKTPSGSDSLPRDPASHAARHAIRHCTRDALQRDPGMHVLEAFFSASHTPALARPGGDIELAHVSWTRDAGHAGA
jgi:hypothetical protein